ncbi:acyltransferase family protein [Uliginosibacterium aquaticum]|uniref:Acyltransferase n=1 Tax=Uliginosibacterium aquaticum TaxID=2731212 RepID=A0ABX2IGM8_9RHOO|nr:acyltransferase [Uliginosibacterium aquaticum]NSL54177.1 acyltransferase [Uliginosibacterium aquaticum]
MNRIRSRLPLIDTLKAIASQLIVLHHLAFYGPMSDIALPLAPDAISWLYDHARMAVQVFLVLAGFLAARSLAPAALPGAIQPLRLIWQRYFRLAVPLAIALLISVLSAALARQLLNHESIPAAPTLWQMVSHTLLLQGVLGQESLSAGVWYIAIDFQLFAMLCLILGAVSKLAHPARVALWLVAGLTCASLLHFNLQSDWDNWGLYFFGAYGLGVMAQWSSRHRHGRVWLLLLCSLGIAALAFEFRPRIALAFATATLLAVAARSGWLERWPDFRLSAWLGQISYSVFLIHFPVCLLVNAVFSRIAPDSPALNLAGMLLAWLLSIGAGHLFYHRIETGLRPQAAVRALRTALSGV